VAAYAGDLEKHWQEIQEKLAKRNWRVYPGEIGLTEAVAFWPAEEPLDRFLDLASVCDCPMIYAASYTFDNVAALDLLLLQDLTEESIFDIDTPHDWLQATGLLETGQARDFLELVKQYEGRIRRIAVQWPFNGVIHLYSQRPAWHEEMEILAGRLAEMLEGY